MTNIFTYGTLMFDEVWSRTVEQGYERSESLLQGYDRKCVRGEVYPVLVPSSPASQVQGITYRNVSASDLARLDEFEGEYYFRKTEQVISLDKTILPADVYVLKEEYYSIITPREWDPVYFITKNIHVFIHQYLGGDRQKH